LRSRPTRSSDSTGYSNASPRSRRTEGQEYTIADVVAMGAPPSVDVLLRWEDGTGSREKTLNLTLFGR
jgi:hypothetical protein